MRYDLEERTVKFARDIIKISKKVPKDLVVAPIVSQLVRAGTSVGANYAEANGASSKKDFKHKIYICKKEANETAYWLRLLAEANEKFFPDLRILSKEAHELTLIFAKIANTSSK